MKQTKKQNFIKMVEYFLSLEGGEINDDSIDIDAAIEYFETFKMIKETPKVEITENGKNIILFMQQNEKETNNIFYAKTIAEGMFVSSRAVSGAMRKLVIDGYVEKMTENPIVYALTDKGREVTF